MFTRKYNVFMSIVTLIFALFIVFINLYIYNLGYSFSIDHGAVNYEITYRTENFNTQEILGEDGFVYTTIPSRFMFYNEEGENLVVSNELAEEYHELNLKVLDLEDTYVFLGSLFVIFNAFGLLLCFKYRFNVTGYIILVIFSLATSLRLGILNYLSIVLVVIGLLGALLVYKSRFIDWNENIFLTFGNKNKVKN